MVPQFLLFWEGEPEDGFEPKAKVLFDHHVLDFLDLESLVFSAERFAERLVHLLINDNSQIKKLKILEQEYQT